MSQQLYPRQLSGHQREEQKVPGCFQQVGPEQFRTISVKATVVLLSAVALLLVTITASCGPSTPTNTSAPTPILTPASTPTKTSTPTPIPSPNVTITFPKEGSSVPIQIVVEGTASGIPSGKELWLLVMSAGVTGYFPQDGPIGISADGKWTASAILGEKNPNDVGRQYVLYPALVDQSGDAKDAISNFFQSGKQTGRYPPIDPLPTKGIQLMSQVHVTRQ